MGVAAPARTPEVEGTIVLCPECGEAMNSVVYFPMPGHGDLRWLFWRCRTNRSHTSVALPLPGRLV